MTQEPTPAAPAPEIATAPAALARRLSMFDVLCIGVNAIVGSGVFSLPDDMHRAMGGWSPLAFLLCSLLLLPVALSFAELSARFDRTGGPYVYATEAFGRHVGFLVGWFCWLNTFISWAANATLFVSVVGVHHALIAPIASAATVLVLGAINYAGIKPGAWIVKVMVIGKIAAILCFVFAGLAALDPSHLGGGLPHGFVGVGQGVYLALFPLQGFEVAPVPAGETRDPARAVPRATVGSLLLAALLFIVVQAVLVMAYPLLASDSERPLADAARYLGPLLGTIVLVGSAVSIGGFTAGSALGSPRYAQAVGEATPRLAFLARVHARYGTPHIAIVLTTVLTAALAVVSDYRSLVGMSNVTVVIQYVATCVAVVILRRKSPAPAGAFRLPFGPVIPVVGAMGSAALMVGAERTELVFAAITLAVGAILAFFALRRGAPAAPTTTPQQPKA